MKKQIYRESDIINLLSEYMHNDAVKHEIQDNIQAYSIYIPNRHILTKLNTIINDALVKGANHE